MKKIVVVSILITLLLSGCSFFGEHRRYANRTTSLVDFLYPNGAVPEEDVKYPVLNLPLRIGLAYTPSRSTENSINPALKQNLIEEIKYAFAQKHYIDEIVVIPEIYLSNNRGFAGLEQIKRLYQLDVVALISYDQVAQTNDNGLAFTYLSIVGSYVFHGTDYDVSTMIDLAAIDIESRQILFRAAATASSSDRDKIVKIRKKTNQAMNADFTTALATLTVKVDQELYAFEERLKRIPPNTKNENGITVKHRKGYSGSTGLGLCVLLMLLIYFNKRPFNRSNA